MRILLADDHAIVRSGLKRIVLDAYNNSTIEEVGSCVELCDSVRKTKYDVLILDIAIGKRNSLEVVPELRKLRPEMPIIILSMYGDRQFVVRALRAGVMAYLTKERAPEELLLAIRRALDGERYIGDTIALQIAEYMTLAGPDATPLHERLSQREYEVFMMLAAAQSVAAIAGQLNLSAKTVSTYRARILEKMGLQSNAEIVRYALQNGIVA